MRRPTQVNRITAKWRSLMLLGLAVIGAGILAAIPGAANAQALKDIRTPQSPLLLKAQGSFYIGGERVEQDRAELGSFGPPGHITINQMYVRYMIPQDGEGNLPVVMIHGMALTGKTWATTPEGRMG